MRTHSVLRTLAIAATLPVLLAACGGSGDDDDTNPAFDTTAGTAGTDGVQRCRSDSDCPLPLLCIELVCRATPGATTGGDDASTATDDGPGGNVTDGADDVGDVGDVSDDGSSTTTDSSGDDGTGTGTDTDSDADADSTTTTGTTGTDTTGPLGECRSDADCFFPSPICLRTTGLCVECLSRADCDAGESCIDNVCSFGSDTGDTETTGNTDVSCPAEKDCRGLECGPDSVCGLSCGRCDTPPSDECPSETTLRKYSGASTCSGAGLCDYAYTDVTCPGGCADGECQDCTPDCTGKICGDDGCGGTCDGCPAGSSCDENNRCVTQMVSVPAGPFFMGCNADVDTDCQTNESPYRSITLSAFKIDKTEVTVAQYKACVDGRGAGCTTPGTTEDCNWGIAGRDNHPVNCVNWTNAAGYCAWVGKRLPTEAEWEKAARGTDGRKYPWGNDAYDCARANLMNCLGLTRAVGEVQSASPYGALDMMGNVMEWVSDWFASNYYSTGPATDPKGPLSGSSRVLRGGSWVNAPPQARTSNRFSNSAETQNRTYGFRCAQ
jgi:formylglycine-generating enzyme